MLFSSISTQNTRAIAQPQHIHPDLWRGSELSTYTRPTIGTGHESLDAELPGRGWPTGVLIELLIARAGIGELRLLRPALASLDPLQTIALINPPYIPNIVCWKNWLKTPLSIFYVRTAQRRDQWWAAEQTLKNGSCAALFCWTDSIPQLALKRLQLAAQTSQTLFVMYRPLAVKAIASPASLRLTLEPDRAGNLHISVIKRRGALHSKLLCLPRDTHNDFMSTQHGDLDRPTPTRTRTLATALAP